MTIKQYYCVSFVLLSLGAALCGYVFVDLYATNSSLAIQSGITALGCILAASLSAKELLRK